MVVTVLSIAAAFVGGFLVANGIMLVREKLKEKAKEKRLTLAYEKGKQASTSLRMGESRLPFDCDCQECTRENELAHEKSNSQA